MAYNPLLITKLSGQPGELERQQLMCFGNSVYHMHENSASQRIDEHRSSFFGKHVRIANAPKPELKITETPQLTRKGKNILISWK